MSEASNPDPAAALLGGCDLDALETFWRGWYGARQDAVRTPESGDRGRVDAGLPPQVRRWLDLRASYDVPDAGWRHAVTVDTVETGSEDGVTTLMWDDQGVWEWGVRADASARRGLSIEVDVSDWRDDGLDLEQWLTAHAVVDVVSSGPLGGLAVGATTAQCRDVLAPMQRLPLPPLPRSPMTSLLFVGPGTVASVADSDNRDDVVFPDGESWELRVAALRPAAIEHLRVMRHLDLTSGTASREEIDAFDGIVWEWFAWE